MKVSELAEYLRHHTYDADILIQDDAGNSFEMLLGFLFCKSFKYETVCHIFLKKKNENAIGRKP